MTESADMRCLLCGFEPIESGLVVCRGCGAAISYSPRWPATLGRLLKALVVIALAVFLLSFGGEVNRAGKDTAQVNVIIRVLGIASLWFVAATALKLTDRYVEQRNRRIGLAKFER
jgi:hypothetical protein